MVAIDRSHKQIQLKNGEKVAYDYLLLCTGQQYQVFYLEAMINYLVASLISRFGNYLK